MWDKGRASIYILRTAFGVGDDFNVESINIVESLESLFSTLNQELDRELLGFNIYRDNGFIASVGPDVYTYMDLGLENGTEYCYYLIAEYSEGDSQPTPTVCASPDAGPMCPYFRLVTCVCAF